MPNGVICGGAVDGSNQLGAIVTCQAMTACPDGAGSAARGGVIGNTSTAATSGPISAGHQRSTEVIRTPSFPDGRENFFRAFDEPSRNVDNIICINGLN